MFLNYLYLVTLMKFKGVLCIYVFLYYEGQADYHSYYVLYMWNKQMSFNALLFMICLCILSCCMHSYYVLLLELHLSCSCLEYFDPSFQCLQMVWSRLWWCMSPQNYSFYHLPTRGRAGVKLGNAWYVVNVSIIFYAPCLFSIYFALLCLLFEAFLYVFWE